MTKPSLMLVLFCSGMLVTLAGCGPSTKQYGMCTYMGVCPEDEGCKDGVREDDGSSCDDDSASKKQPWPSHSTGEMGDGGDSQ